MVDALTLTAAMPTLEAAALQFVVLLFLCIAVAVGCKLVRLPYTIALVLAGLAIALVPMPGLEAVTKPQLLPDLVFFVFLPALLFQGALNLDFEQLKRNGRTIALLAIPGLLLSTAVTGLVFYLLASVAFGLAVPLRWCLVFGALISPTDPISVLAIFKAVHVPERLRVIVEGESLFNDGAGITLFRTLLAVAMATTDFHLLGVAWDFVRVFAGGAVIGLALGMLAYLLMRWLHDHLLEVMITVLVAYGAFVGAELLHLSGVISTVCAGLVIGNPGRTFAMQGEVREAVDLFLEIIDFILNALLFLLIGLELQYVPHDLTQLGLWAPVVAGCAAHLVGRSTAIYPSAWLAARWNPALTRRWAHVLFWGGLKGSIPLALVLTLPKGSEIRSLLLVATFAVVVWSLVLQGLTMRPLLNRLGVGAAPEAGE